MYRDVLFYVIPDVKRIYGTCTYFSSYLLNGKGYLPSSSVSTQVKKLPVGTGFTP